MKIAVCGSRKPFSKDDFAIAKELGKQIALAGFETVTGATIGVTLEAARGAKEANGMVFGVSPAKDQKEQVEKYDYPVKEFDEINFTGKGFLKRNIILVSKADAVLFVGGSVGTLNEFSIALQQQKIIGVLSGVKGVSGNAIKILEIIGLKDYKIFFSSANPKELVKKIKKELQK